MRLSRFNSWSIVMFLSVPAMGDPDLRGLWVVEADCTYSPDWHWTAKLEITEADYDGSRYNLSGSFEWKGTNGVIIGYGIEEFSYRKERDCWFDPGLMEFLVQAYEVHDVDPPGIIEPCIFAAQVAPNGDHLFNGKWTGFNGFDLGTWEATRVPEPTTLSLLFAAGVLAVRRTRPKLMGN